MFLLANVIVQLLGVAVREGLGWKWVTPGGSAAGASVAAVLIVTALANKQRAGS